MEVDDIADSDLSFNKKSEVSLIHDQQVFAWYFKKVSTYSDRLAEIQLKPDTTSLRGGNFSKNFCILGSLQKVGVCEEWKCFDRNLYSFSEM